MGATDLHNTLIMFFFKTRPSRHPCSIPKIIYGMLMNNSVMMRRTKVKCQIDVPCNLHIDLKLSNVEVCPWQP